MKTSTIDTLKQNRLRVGLCSYGLTKFHQLDRFLQLDDATFGYAFAATGFDLFIGWGTKPSGRRAVRLAEKSGKPFLLLEDAFVRSVSPHSIGGEGPLGILLDDEGIYYDPSRPSRLEDLIRTAAGDADAVHKGGQLIDFLKSWSLSKYNNFSGLEPPLRNMLKDGGVLVVDQTWQDRSVTASGGDEASFAAMLAAAIDENPHDQIFVKLHPEVMADKKRGYLKQMARNYRCTLLSDNLNPWQLFDYISKVYTVSSQLGFDALLAGRQVRCFGMPFYAGWGITVDETKCQRRNGCQTTIKAMAHAACNTYARYIDAYDAKPVDVFIAGRQIAHIRDIYQANSQLSAFYQVTLWKQHRISQMFKTTVRKPAFFKKKSLAISTAQKEGGAIAAWASRIDDRFAGECRDKGVGLHRLEDGFIRSVGLGASFHLPMSLVLDDLGIYYDARQPSRLEYILQHHNFDQTLITRAASLKTAMVEKNITKYNLDAQEKSLCFPGDKKIILVPGQVDDDASIKYGGANMNSLEFLDQVRRQNRECFVVFKPHPDVLSGQRRGLSDKATALKHADYFAGDIPIGRLLDSCDEVHTISSLTGFEALLRNKKVTCYGMPFYAGWGLTNDKNKCERRNRVLTLTELVAGTLIIYPRYFDPVSKLPCGPELVIQRIEEQRLSPGKTPVLVRLRRGYGKARRAFYRSGK